jgi:hypothetical protein
MDSYRKGLDGAQAVWVSKKYHRHWSIPPEATREMIAKWMKPKKL